MALALSFDYFTRKQFENAFASVSDETPNLGNPRNTYLLLCVDKKLTLIRRSLV